VTDANDLLDGLAGGGRHERQAQQIGYLATLAVTKYRLVSAACWLMLTTVALLLAAGTLALIA
jgi:hypothetical protein